MSAKTRQQITQLSEDAEELLHETWELFARLRQTNEALMKQTGDFVSKLNRLSRESADENSR